MKVIFEFDSIEEAAELDIAFNASKWYSVVHEMDQRLRAMAKYEGSTHAEEIREILREIIYENGVKL
jgi:hypothetical protein